MMKSFFKKLASVLALAMVVSLAAPAAQTAQAAEAKKFTYHYSNGGSAVTTVNLAKTGDTVDLNFVGIKDYKDYKTQWVPGPGSTGFTVSQSGVITATADNGGGLVWLSVGDDQTYVSDPVKVTIGEYTNVTIGSQDKSNRDLGAVTLKVGQSMDLAFFGILDWNLGKYTYKWVPADSSVISVDQKTGEITALKAGETTLTFMALNKYNYTNGITTKPLTVTVKPAKTTFVVDNGTTGVNTTEKQIDVYFSEAFNMNVEDVELYRVFEADDDPVGDGNITDLKKVHGYEEKYVTSVKGDDKNAKHWAINAYDALEDGETYEIRIKNLDPVRFTASVGAVAKVVVVEEVKAVLEEEFEAAVDAELGVKLYDAKGVYVNGVKCGNDLNESEEYITFTTVNEENGFDLTVDRITFYTDCVAQVVATYDNGEVTVSSDERAIRPDDNGAYGVRRGLVWTIINDSDKNYKIDWKKPNHKIAANDTFRKIVVLFEDTRGELYTTDYRGANDTYDGDRVAQLTLASDDTDTFDDLLFNTENTVFAKNGCYVEFKAMDADELLIDVDGGIESYKKTNTNWALYLYNYRFEGEQFDKEIIDGRINIDAPREVTKIVPNEENFNILLFTEKDSDQEANAYYKNFSMGQVVFDIYDQYGDSWFTDKLDVGSTVEDPNFKVTYASKYTALADVFADYEAQLNDDLLGDRYVNNGGVSSVRDAEIAFELNNFLDLDKYAAQATADDKNKDGKVTLDEVLLAGTKIEFTVTETNSGWDEKITINIVTPNQNIRVAGKDYNQDTAVVKESQLLAGLNAESYALPGKNTDVNSKVTQRWNKVNTLGNTIKTLALLQGDERGKTIGFENNIFIAEKMPWSKTVDGKVYRYVLHADDFMDVTQDDTNANEANANFNTKATGPAVAASDIVTGSKIVVVELPREAGGGILNYTKVGNKNGAYSAKEAKTYGTYENGGYAAKATATGLGISFDTVASESQAGNDTYYNQYKFTFADIDDTTSEVNFLPFGKYKVTVFTVERIDDIDDDGTDDYILSSNSAWKKEYTFNFTDDMPEVTLNKRENATTSVYLGYVDAKVHDEEFVKQLICDNFTFNWNGSNFLGKTKGDGIQPEDILCYTVQKSTNNQIVIKDVVFKVYIDWDNDGNTTDPDEIYWYRSTATVNKSLTYKEEN